MIPTPSINYINSNKNSIHVQMALKPYTTIIKGDYMNKWIGILAFNALSLSALAGDFSSNHTVTVKVKGNLDCQSLEIDTGYLPGRMDIARLRVATSELSRHTLLKHDQMSAQRRSGLCAQLSALPLADGNTTAQLNIAVSSHELQQAEANRQIVESLTLTFPDGTSLHSTQYGLLRQQ